MARGRRESVRAVGERARGRLEGKERESEVGWQERKRKEK